MAEHRFKVGERVHVVKTGASPAETLIGRSVPYDRKAVWDIVKLMPSDAGGPQYHVQSTDGARRAVHEFELRRA